MTPSGLLAELDRVQEHIRTFKEYGQPLPQALLDKLKAIRKEAGEGMDAQE